MNVFVKPDEQSQICLSLAMASKRTFKNDFAYPCIMFLLSTIMQANLYPQTIFFSCCRPAVYSGKIANLSNLTQNNTYNLTPKSYIQTITSYKSTHISYNFLVFK